MDKTTKVYLLNVFTFGWSMAFMLSFAFQLQWEYCGLFFLFSILNGYFVWKGWSEFKINK